MTHSRSGEQPSDQSRPVLRRERTFDLELSPRDSNLVEISLESPQKEVRPFPKKMSPKEKRRVGRDHEKILSEFGKLRQQHQLKIAMEVRKLEAMEKELALKVRHAQVRMS